jgi:hypothetical protein
MDTLAHGLWGGAAFGQRARSQFKWAFILGMCPDLFSFGPFFITHLGDIGERWMHHKFGPPPHHLIPAYVYHAYNVTHSLVVWTGLCVIAWGVSAYRRNTGTVSPIRTYAVTPIQTIWPLGAWGLHILCDIPLHSTRFFPTPYLWPFHTPFVNGIPWARGRFMLINYLLIGSAYIAILIRRRLSPPEGSASC